MPNWTHNVMKFHTKADFNRIVKDCIKGKDFDFNTLIPMPDIIKDTESGSEEHELLNFAKRCSGNSPEEILKKYMKETKRVFDADRAKKLCNSLKALKEYGFPDWYEWSNAKWGTKWNACDTYTDENDLTLSFYTAWATPIGVIEAMAKKYPDMEIEIRAVNEDAGEDYGVYEISIREGSVYVDSCGLDEDELAEQEAWEEEA